MKIRPDITVAEVLSQMLDAEFLPDKVSDPMPLPARIKEQEQIREAILAGTISFACVGCDQSVEAKDAEACECGGFVCPACRAVEEDGICNHERPPGIPHDDEDE